MIYMFYYVNYMTLIIKFNYNYNKINHILQPFIKNKFQ